MPFPPPGTGVPIGSIGSAAFAAVDALLGAVVAIGEATGAGEVSFLLNQERLAGLGDTLGAGDASFFARVRFAGLGEASGLVAGDADGAGDASFFARFGFAVGEASGLVAGDVDGAGDASFFARLCLAGLAEASGLALGAGDWATNVTSKNPVKVIIRAMDLVMTEEY